MQVRVFEHAEAAAVYAAAIMEFVIQHGREPVLGLATGSTPIPLYRQLVQFHRHGLSFANVTTINLDEYVGLDSGHPQSYRAFMQENLFDHIDVRADRTHMPDGAALDLQAECRRYDQVIAALPIDVQILGIGRNGHIGFNEPGKALKAQTHAVELAPDTIASNARFFASPDEVPKRAITVGLQSILTAKQILLLAFGPEKAEAVRNAVAGDVRTSLPASVLQVHPHVTFVLDVQAAALLHSDALA